MGLLALLGLIIGIGAGGATYAIAKKKKVGTGGSAAAGIAIGAVTAWYLWPVILAGGVVYYVIDRNKKQKALKPAD